MSLFTEKFGIDPRSRIRFHTGGYGGPEKGDEHANGSTASGPGTTNDSHGDGWGGLDYGYDANNPGGKPSNDDVLRESLEKKIKALEDYKKEIEKALNKKPEAESKLKGRLAAVAKTLGHLHDLQKAAKTGNITETLAKIALDYVGMSSPMVTAVSVFAQVLTDSLMPDADSVAKRDFAQEAKEKPEDERTDYEKTVVSREDRLSAAREAAMQQLGGAYSDWADPTWPPVVLDLDGDGLELVNQSSSSVFFDYDNDGYRENVGWVKSDDGILAIDLDGNGVIDSANEIAFANQTTTKDTDLEALASLYDSNADGVLNSNDSRWSSFRVWQDFDQDGVSSQQELKSLNEIGIESINLKLTPVEYDKQLLEGNRVLNTTEYMRLDNSKGIVGDVALTASLGGISSIDGVLGWK